VRVLLDINVVLDGLLVTRDPDGFGGAAMPVLTPADLLARLAQGTP
jgi:hypothetical protein